MEKYGWRGGKFEGGNRYEKLLKKSESNKSKEDKYSREVENKWQEKWRRQSDEEKQLRRVNVSEDNIVVVDMHCEKLMTE